MTGYCETSFWHMKERREGFTLQLVDLRGICYSAELIKIMRAQVKGAVGQE